MTSAAVHGQIKISSHGILAEFYTVLGCEVFKLGNFLLALFDDSHRTALVSSHESGNHPHHPAAIDYDSLAGPGLQHRKSVNNAAGRFSKGY